MHWRYPVLDLWLLVVGILSAFAVVGCLVGWYVNLPTCAALTLAYLSWLIFRTDWWQHIRRCRQSGFRFGDLTVPLIPVATMWLTAAYVRGWLDPERTASLQALLRDWFLR